MSRILIRLDSHGTIEDMASDGPDDEMIVLGGGNFTDDPSIMYHGHRMAVEWRTASYLNGALGCGEMGASEVSYVFEKWNKSPIKPDLEGE